MQVKPEIPKSVSFRKRVVYNAILNSIGKDGNYRQNINTAVKDVTASTVGDYLQQMKRLGLVHREVVPNGRSNSWVGIWKWKV